MTLGGGVGSFNASMKLWAAVRTEPTAPAYAQRSQASSTSDTSIPQAFSPTDFAAGGGTVLGGAAATGELMAAVSPSTRETTAAIAPKRRPTRTPWRVRRLAGSPSRYPCVRTA